MSEPKLQKVAEAEDRNLPVFEEFDRLADRIRLEAYKLFTQRGASGGNALDDWLAAEREVVAWPTAELAETDKAYSLKVALPGFEPADITVTATPREIIVKGSHTQETKPAEGPAAKAGRKKGQVCWSEISTRDTFRRVEFPAPVDVESITASVKNGLLEISASKADSAAGGAKRIAVSAGR